MENKEKQFFSKHDPQIVPAIRNAVIGIAGAGGLGSNIAIALARAGIGKIVIADFDEVDISNLNRQQYFLDQIGQKKVHALKHNLEKINPFSEYQVHDKKVNSSNLQTLFEDCHLLLEAFDKAEMKEMLVETWTSHFPEKPVIIASGLAGYGKNDLLKTRKIDNLYICGDETSELQKNISPMAPRVAIVANMQANLALELVIKGKLDE